VRVLSMGHDDGADYSVELCGGTHVQALGDIGLFVIISESAVSSGVRRVEALTGESARAWLTSRDRQVKEIAGLLKTSTDEAPGRVAALVEERKHLERALAEAQKTLAMGGGSASSAPQMEDIGGVKFSGQVLDGLNPKELRSLVDEAKQNLGSGIAALFAVNDGRGAVAVGVTDDLTDKFNAVSLVQVAVQAMGGKGGGGRPDMAQGGGPSGGDAAQALDQVRAAIAE